MSSTKAVAYVRVSTEAQASEGISLGAQEERVLAYATAMDINIVEVVRDAGASGKSLDRPGLKRTLALVDTGAANAVIVPKLDRLTRSVRDLAHLIEEYFADGHVALISLGESVDTRTAGGRLVLHVLGSVSEWERSIIGERTREALQHLKRNGIRMGGPGLGWRYGEQVDDEGRHRVEDVEVELRVVRRIQELRRAGLSLRAVASTLSAEGWKTKRGARWHPTTVLRVLKRSTAATLQPALAST